MTDNNESKDDTQINNDQALKKQVIQYLLDCLDLNIQDYVDLKDNPIPLSKLTKAQAVLLEDASRMQRKYPSKLRVIELISKISGFNTQNHKILGSKDDPLIFDFKVNVVTTDDNKDK